MRITRIYERNLIGIEEVDFQPKTLTAITGKNGAGKSSVIAGLTAMVDGGHRAELIRKGQKSGEVVIELDNGWKFRKPLRKSASSVEGSDENGTPIPNPATVLKELFSLKTVNVNKFVAQSPKEMAEYLLQLCDLTLTPDMLAGTGISLSDLGVSEMVFESNGLDALKAIHDAAYEQRRALGAKRDEKKGTVATLSEGLPEDLAEGHAARLTELRPKLGDTENAIKAAVGDITIKYERLRAGRLAEATKEAETAKAALRKVESDIASKKAETDTAVAELTSGHKDVLAALLADYNTKIAKANRQFEASKADILKGANEATSGIVAQRAQRDGELESLRQQWATEEATLDAERELEIAAIHSGYDKNFFAVKLEVQRMEGERDAWIKAGAVRDLRDTSRSEAEILNEQYKALTAQLVALDKLKLKMVESLPIKDLAPDPEHCLVYEGVPLATVNTAKRFMLAFNAAAISPAEIPLVFVDGLEILDEENFKHFEEVAMALGESKGMQFIYTMRSWGQEPLRIESR